MTNRIYLSVLGALMIIVQVIGAVGIYMNWSFITMFQLLFGGLMFLGYNFVAVLLIIKGVENE